jgi:hypothetical protein
MKNAYPRFFKVQKAKTNNPRQKSRNKANILKLTDVFFAHFARFLLRFFCALDFSTIKVRTNFP